jgi:DNA polymerase-3 subunit epsilon
LANEDTARRRRVAQTAREWLALDPLFLDTETTGYGDRDEIVSVAVVTANGKVVFHTMVKPSKPIPAEATAIHGITDEQVEGLPTFDQIWDSLVSLLDGRLLVIWNAEFDLRMIRQSSPRARDFTPHNHCAMLLYADFYGEWDSYHGNYRWQKLQNAAAQCGITFERDLLHDALFDAELCRQIVQVMTNSAT